MLVLQTVITQLVCMDTRWKFKMANKSKASKLFKQGKWNYCQQELDCTTGIRTITFIKHGDKKRHKFKVKNLGKPNEKIVEDEEVADDVIT